jgi:hypothetical protein
MILQPETVPTTQRLDVRLVIGLFIDMAIREPGTEAGAGDCRFDAVAKDPYCQPNPASVLG